LLRHQLLFADVLKDTCSFRVWFLWTVTETERNDCLSKPIDAARLVQVAKQITQSNTQ